jgi:para-aminobenzoate synthetase component 1
MAMMKTLPLSVEIPYEDPAKLFEHFANQPWSFLLDSADSCRQLEDTNRFSYIAFNPFEKIVLKNKKINDQQSIDNPFSYLKNILAKFQIDHQAALPPFQGGAAGYFSYDLCHYLEKINRPLQAEESVYADLAIGLYDLIISFDHVLQKAWIVSTGFPEKKNLARLEKAEQQIKYCLDRLAEKNNPSTHQSVVEEVSLASPLSKNDYAMLVKKAQNYILEGDIFEVTLSHRFQAELKPDQQEDRYQLYLRMRGSNPSPFSAYLNLGDYQILSASPERFLLLNHDGTVSTRPIKGTAARGKSLAEDKQIAEALRTSEKDRSENIMITDLLRNDLSKVCTPESVTVKKLCGLETYPTVHHLVTVVEGKLRPEVTPSDLLEACFPGGSITGAPKVRAMQIIYELEPTQRGPYCGSIGFIGFSGTMDTSIVIRTLLSHGNILSYQAGGAVVLDSSPDGEYEETLAKSVSIKKTLASKR